MLKKRLITAAILVPLLLFAILYAHPLVLLGLLVFALGLAANEWQVLIPVLTIPHRAIFWGLLVVATLVCWLCFAFWLAMGLLTWAFVVLAILTYPASQRVWGFPWLVALLGCVFFPLVGVSAAGLYQQSHGAGLIIYVLALVSISDSGAYFVGNWLGKHALIPRVSSGKTIEGALGGLLLPMGVALIGYIMWSPASAPIWFGLAALTVVMSMFGDLTVSMLKRRQHLKDTGTLLPGHGGVLDRLDSLLSALPLFYAGYYYYVLPGLA